MVYRLLFLNVHGLTPEKLETIVTVLDEEKYDVVALNETWFQWRVPDLLDHPYLICHSLQFRERPLPHLPLPGGCAVFAHPKHHSRITSTPLNDAVCWSFQGQKAAVIYLPPSLDVPHIRDYLDACGELDLLVGDVNAVKGRNNTRSNTLLCHMRTGGLEWLVPEGRISPTDHLFSRPHVAISYATVPLAHLGIASDHPLGLEAVVRGKTAERRARKERLPGSCTYDFRALESPDSRIRAAAKRSLIAAYADIQTSVANALRFYDEASLAILESASRPGFRQGLKYKLKDLQEIVSSVDEILVNALQNTADKLFKLSREPLPPTHLQAGTGDPLRNFKRITRAEQVLKRPQIVSDSAAGCVVEDVTRRLTELWTPSRQEKRMRELSFVYPERHSKVLDYVTVEAVRKAIIAYPIDKASGTDGLAIVLLKNLRRGAFAHHLTTAFRIFARLSVTPLRWNESLTILIAKDEGRTCPAARTRPIAVSPMFRRLFEKVTLPALQAHPKLQLRPAQTGFQKGKSTAINIALLHVELQDKRMRTALLDMADCYDRLSFAYMRDVLKERKVDAHTRNLIISMTQVGSSTVVSVNGRFTRKIMRHRGVPQGSGWSPFLYNLAADKLVEMVEAKNATFPVTEALPYVPRPIGLFADDSSVQAMSDERLILLINVVVQWCALADMKLSWPKCVALGTDSNLLGLGEADSLIRVEERARYLGVDFRIDAKGRGVDWEFYFRHKLQGARIVFRSLCRLAKSWHPGRRLALVRSFLCSRLEYMAGLFFWIAATDANLSPRTSRKSVIAIARHLRADKTWAPVWKDLDQEWGRWSKFILGGSFVGGGHSRAPTVHGIEPPSRRFVELGVLLRKQLLTLKKKMPIMQGTTEALGMHRWGKLKRMEERGPLNALLKREKVVRLIAGYGELGKRISVEARSPSGTDRIFQVKCPALCTALIKWRQGTWGFRRYTKCVCGREYYFGHWLKCASVSPKVREREIEGLLEAPSIPEAVIRGKLERWEIQLADTPGQEEEVSRLTVHTRPTPAMQRRLRSAASTRPNDEIDSATLDEGWNTAVEVDGFITAPEDF